MNESPLNFSLLIGKRFLKLGSEPREFIFFAKAHELWHNFEDQPPKKCLYAPDREYFSIGWGVGAVFDCYPKGDMTKFTEHASNGTQYEWVRWEEEKLSDESSCC